jgi:hypothetical protein
VNAIIGSAALALVIHFLVEQQRVRRFVRGMNITAAGDRSLRVATEITGRVYSDVTSCSDDKSFISLSLLNSLGATPVGVLRAGGCCSGKSRLAIVALDSMQIPAGQLTLYHADGHAQHCLIEASCREGRAIIDPTYGLLFVGENGHAMGLPELRAGARPGFRSLPGSTMTNYPGKSYYDFDYPNTRTANWTKSWKRRCAYRALCFLTGGRIDSMWQPVLLEWPQLVLAIALMSVLLVIDVIVFAI